MTLRAADFLQFAARIYSLPGMKDICMKLQDEQKLNVNCLLLAAWAAKHGMVIGASDWRAMEDVIRPVEDSATKPIRSLRRSVWKNDNLDKDLRGAVKRFLLYAELRTEHFVETLLHDELMRRARPGQPDLLGLLLAYAGPPTPEVLEFARLVRQSNY
jgi:uncharacterized protein (TIGR02444 family)